ncbi:MAG TPA: ABC transporter permease, partial [Eggerthellaceae bacterium]|nr:ABC transporter permease [Eggerthellaceae bacterium]
YNLTNINIEERIREIATLKVLGFTRRETNAYIFREIILLAFIGGAVGLVLGVFLEGFVVTTAEVDQVMFGRSIHPPSFAASYVLTIVFSAISMLLMLPKLAKVNMVESLKSVE